MLYHDLYAGYSMGNGLQIAVGLDNATDRHPPFLVNAGIANTDEATYRLLRRTGRLLARIQI